MKLKLFKFRQASPVCASCASRSARRIRSDRSGLTLIELMLVVAIMVVVAAIAAPAIQRSFSRQALQKGADRVRVAMGQARVKAIRGGEEYAVFFTPGGSWFNVAKFTDFQQQNGLASQRQRLVDEGRASNFEEDLLPKGVLFAASNTGQNSRDASVLSESSSGGGTAIGMVLFYPDGTSQDAKMALVNEKQMYIQLQLRGLTGVARSVRMENPENVQ